MQTQIDIRGNIPCLDYLFEPHCLFYVLLVMIRYEINTALRGLIGKIRLNINSRTFLFIQSLNSLGIIPGVPKKGGTIYKIASSLEKFGFKKNTLISEDSRWTWNKQLSDSWVLLVDYTFCNIQGIIIIFWYCIYITNLDFIKVQYYNNN